MLLAGHGGVTPVKDGAQAKAKDYWIRIKSEHYVALSPLDMESCVEPISAEILGPSFDESGDDAEESVVGWAFLHRIRLDLAVNYQLPLFEACDSIDQEVWDLSDAVIDFDTGYIKEKILDKMGISSASTVLLVNSVMLQPAHRGIGVGAWAMQTLIKVLAGDGLVVCKPHPMHDAGNPLPEKDLAAACAKLKKHWCQVGFQPLGRTGLLAYWGGSVMPDLAE